MESVQSLVSAVTLLTSCVIVSVFVPPEIIVNNDAIDIVPPIYKHPFIEPSIPSIDIKPYDDTIPSIEETEPIIEEPTYVEEVEEEEIMPEEPIEVEEEVVEVPPPPVEEPVVIEEETVVIPQEPSIPISDRIQEYVNRGKIIGIKLLSDPQYSHFRILVDVLSIILCILLFKACTKRRDIPVDLVLAKQNELNYLNAQVEGRLEEDRENALTLAKTLPELQNMNSEYKNETKIRDELRMQLRSHDDEDITLQQQDELSPSVQEEMKRLEGEEEAHLLAIKKEKARVEREEKERLEKEKSEAARIATLNKLKEEEDAKLLLQKEAALKEEANRRELERQEQIKREQQEQIKREQQEQQEQIKRDQQEKERQEQLKVNLEKGVEVETIHIGSHVRVNGSEIGVVRHHGPVTGLEGDYYGIEFDVPVGKNDGTAPSGERYFVTKKNHGLFVTREKLSLVQ